MLSCAFGYEGANGGAGEKIGARIGSNTIKQIKLGSPAERGGLLVGDVVVAVDGYVVGDGGSASELLSRRHVGPDRTSTEPEAECEKGQSP